jgi:hypothetical protein
MRWLIFLVLTSLFSSLITQMEANSLLKTLYDLKDISTILNSIPYKLEKVSNGMDTYLGQEEYKAEYKTEYKTEYEAEYKPHKYYYVKTTTTPTTTTTTTTTTTVQCK